MCWTNEDNVYADSSFSMVIVIVMKYHTADSGSDIIVIRFRSIQLPISDDEYDENNFDEYSQRLEYDCIP